MRRFVIQFLIPTFFFIFPFLIAALVGLSIPDAAFVFFIEHIGKMEVLILGLGTGLFTLQMLLCWKALRLRGAGFNETADRWINHLAQSAEWFPMLGLLGTVGGILQTFSIIGSSTTPSEIIRNYAPAITATGAGLFMAFINMLPPWMVIMGRDLLLTLSGARNVGEEAAP